jgi:hypothetical protein
MNEAGMWIGCHWESLCIILTLKFWINLDQPSWFKLELFFPPGSQGLLLARKRGGLNIETLPNPPPKSSVGANIFWSKNHHQGGLAHALSKVGCFFYLNLSVGMRLECGLLGNMSACASSSLWNSEWIWINLVGSNLYFFFHPAPRAYCWAKRRGGLGIETLPTYPQTHRRS